MEIQDDEIGTVAAGELSPTRSWVRLKLALLKTADPTKIQKYFFTY